MTANESMVDGSVLSHGSSSRRDVVVKLNAKSALAWRAGSDLFQFSFGLVRVRKHYR